MIPPAGELIFNWKAMRTLKLMNWRALLVGRMPPYPRQWILERRMNRNHATTTLVAFVACVCIVAALASCETSKVTTSDGRPMPPEPRAVQQVPEGVAANRMAFSVGIKPEDSNSNGFPDLIRVSVSLFRKPEYNMSLRQDGSFVFELFAAGAAAQPDAEPVHAWLFTGDDVRQAETDAIYGPCYQFTLSLAGTEVERVPRVRADLLCRFIPADGSTPVVSEGVRSIQIGRRVGE
jgi:hypothetical protein